MKINENALQDMIDQHNPFMQKEVDGTICYYKTYCEAYLAFLKWLYVNYPRGYIDAVVMLADFYGDAMPNRDCVAAVESWQRRGFENPQIVDWFYHRGELVNDLEEIVKYMHWFTETSFKRDLYLVAFSEFCTFVDIAKEMKEKEDGKTTADDKKPA